MEPRIGRATAGFTLIELMIVVTILSLLAVSVALGVNRPGAADAQDWARFSALHERLRAQAILSGEPVALSLAEGGTQRLMRAGGAWQAAGTAQAWRGRVDVLLPYEPDRPLVFTPGGQTTPVRLRFETAAGVRICETRGWEPLTCSDA